MTRDTFFSQPVPTAPEQALLAFTQLRDLDLMFHLDDDPAEVFSTTTGERVFTDAEAIWIRKLIDTCADLFKDFDGPWTAAALSCYYVHIETEVFEAAARAIVKNVQARRGLTRGTPLKLADMDAPLSPEAVEFLKGMREIGRAEQGLQSSEWWKPQAPQTDGSPKTSFGTSADENTRVQLLTDDRSHWTCWRFDTAGTFLRVYTEVTGTLSYVSYLTGDRQAMLADYLDIVGADDIPEANANQIRDNLARHLDALPAPLKTEN